MPHLMILERSYHSPGDESAFYNWLKAIPGVTEACGSPLGLQVTLRTNRLSNVALRELIGLHWRYGLPMRDLSRFLTDRNRVWFSDPKMYWHDAVFGPDALPASLLERRSELLATGLTPAKADQKIAREYRLNPLEVRHYLISREAV